MPDRALTRICYVEDDEDIQRIVRMSLERVGKMTVEIVGDPTMAIEAMTAFRPDLVMLDWMMPAMDGPTLFRQMQLRPETKALPVVFITAKASQRDLDELIAMGAAGAISEPFSPKDRPEQLRAIWAKLLWCSLWVLSAGAAGGAWKYRRERKPITSSALRKRASRSFSTSLSSSRW